MRKGEINKQNDNYDNIYIETQERCRIEEAPSRPIRPVG